jgi:hypothetical protein
MHMCRWIWRRQQMHDWLQHYCMHADLVLPRRVLPWRRLVWLHGLQPQQRRTLWCMLGRLNV